MEGQQGPRVSLRRLVAYLAAAGFAVEANGGLLAARRKGFLGGQSKSRRLQSAEQHGAAVARRRARNRVASASRAVNR